MESYSTCLCAGDKLCLVKGSISSRRNPNQHNSFIEYYDPDKNEWQEIAPFPLACVAGVIGEGEGKQGRREKMRGVVNPPHFFSPPSLPFPFPDYAGHAGYIPFGVVQCTGFALEQNYFCLFNESV